MNQIIRFLYPGVRLKRWILLFLLSAFVFLTGLSGVMGKLLSGIKLSVFNVEKYLNPLRDYITSSTKWVTIDIIAICVGALGLYLGIRFFFRAVNTLYPSNIDIVKVAYDSLKLRKGPRIVTLGGGTGLSTLLKGLKGFSSNLTAVVTVADDGGSSGKLRKQLKMLPPGDIRNCLVALADSSGILGRVFQYRFKSKNKNLDGHSFGNLFIAALTNVSGSFEKGVQEVSKILAIRGSVLPVTLEKVVLEAKLKNKRTLKGQYTISQSKYAIDKIILVPNNPLPSAGALNAIRKAKLIILGPGSLYTSIIPNLIIREIAETVYHSKAPVVYICNIMTQPGETKGYRLSDHLNALEKHIPFRNFINYIIVNNQQIPESILTKYAKKDSFPVEIDSASMKKYDSKIIRKDLVQIVDGHLVRHDPEKLAKIILRLTL